MSGSISSNSSGNLELYSGATKVLTADASTGIISFVKTPTVPTPAVGANDTQVATTAFAMGAGLGCNQTWQNVSANRALNTTYTNSTPRPIFISVTVGGSNTTGVNYGFNINGVVATRSYENSGYDQEFNIIVPPGATYSFVSPDGGITFWGELR